MLLREPKDHLVAHEDGELLIEFAAVFGLGETAGYGHEGRGEEAFGRERAHQGLEVGREAEGDGFRVVEEGFAVDEGGDEFGAPDVAGGAGDGEFVGEAGGHVHGVGHEGEGGELVGEAFAEEEEVGVGGVGGLEEFEGEVGGDPFRADGGVDFCAEGGVVGWVRGVLRVGTEFVHCEEDGVISVDAVAAAIVFVYTLEGDVGCVILD